MNILKNKFVIALLLSVVLMGCFMKFNQYKNLNSEESEDHQDESREDETLANKAVKYLKQFVVSYGVSLLLVFLGFKGHDYYMSKGSIDQSGGATSNKSVDSSKKNDSDSGSVSDSGSSSESGGALSSLKSLFKSSSGEQELPSKTESPSPKVERQPEVETTNKPSQQSKQQSGANSDLVNDLNNERRLIMEKARLFKLKQQSLNNQNSKGEKGEKAAQSGGNTKTSGVSSGGNQNKTARKEEYFNTGEPNF